MINKNDYINKSMDNKTINVGLNVVIFKEDEQFIAYCPALNLSSYGNSSEIAKKRFETELEIFFEETEKRGTLEKLLLQLGWALVKKPKPKYQPPKIKYPYPKIESFTEHVAIPI